MSDKYPNIRKVFGHYDELIKHRSGAMGQMIPCCGTHMVYSDACVEFGEMINKIDRLTTENNAFKKQVDDMNSVIIELSKNNAEKHNEVESLKALIKRAIYVFSPQHPTDELMILKELKQAITEKE